MRSATNFTGRPTSRAIATVADLVGIKMDFHAEEPPDMRTHHANAALVETEMRRIMRSQLMRRGVALIDRQTIIARQIAGDDAARFDRTTCQPMEAERLLDHHSGCIEGSSLGSSPICEL